MIFETGSYFLDSLIAVVLDVRLQIIIGTIGLIHWNWRLPRPMKGAGNKAVFITGCDTGMGHRMAKRFDQMKMHVFAGCLYPEGKGAKSLKETCSGRLHVVPLDVTNEDQIKEAVAYVKANLPDVERVNLFTASRPRTHSVRKKLLESQKYHFEASILFLKLSLYCLINNAGVLPYTNFELMTTEMCEEAVNINLMGAIRVTKHFLPLISEVPGRIVTITSILARLSFPNTSVYSATKHGLDGFFSSLRFDLLNLGIHVATVEPGDFSRTTDIMQWTQKWLDKIWKHLSVEEKKAKRHLYDEAKKKTSVQKVSEAQQEYNYKLLLQDVEDAMLAEEPHWRYVSAPLSTRIFLWFLRMLPEELSFKLTSAKSIK